MVVPLKHCCDAHLSGGRGGEVSRVPTFAALHTGKSTRRLSVTYVATPHHIHILCRRIRQNLARLRSSTSKSFLHQNAQVRRQRCLVKTVDPYTFCSKTKSIGQRAAHSSAVTAPSLLRNETTMSERRSAWIAAAMSSPVHVGVESTTAISIPVHVTPAPTNKDASCTTSYMRIRLTNLHIQRTADSNPKSIRPACNLKHLTLQTFPKTTLATHIAQSSRRG
jgi:hypothetical protein